MLEKRAILAITLVDDDGDHATTVEEIQLDSEKTAVISPLIHLFKALRSDHQSDAQIEGKTVNAGGKSGSAPRLPTAFLLLLAPI